MTKKPTELASLGGSVLLDRRKLFGTLGMAAAGVTAASLLPFKPALASAPARAVTGNMAFAPIQTGDDEAQALQGHIYPIPYVYPRVSEEVAFDPMDHVFVA